MTYTTDMTKGSELKHIVRFALPMLAGNLFQQLYNIVDSVIVGRYLGYQALASVGATGSITYLFYSLCIGLSTAAGILVAQRFGAQKYDEVKLYIANSAYVTAIFGIFLSVASVLATPLLLRMLNTPESVFDASVGYMRIACTGTIAVAAYNWIGSVMRSLGDAKTPLIFLVVASILNAVLDILFVVVLGMGVNGAAWATVVAQALSAAGSITFAFKKNPMFWLDRQSARLDKRAASLCVRMGTPIALQNALVSVSMIWLQRIANSFGDTIMAAYTATMRVEQLIQQPFSSLGTAVSSFTGQNVGAGHKDRVKKCYAQSMLLVAGFAAVMLIMFLIFAGNIVGLFVKEPDVVSIGADAMKLSACFYVFLGTIHVTRGLLNGAGDVKFALMNGIAEVVGRIGFALLLINLTNVGCMAVWGTTCLTWALTAIMSVIRYLCGGWKKKLEMPRNNSKNS